jgi:hypothetical protein
MRLRARSGARRSRKKIVRDRMNTGRGYGHDAS